MSDKYLEGFPVRAQNALAQTIGAIEKVEAQVEAAEISNDETLGHAGDLDKYIGTQIKIGDEKRKEFTEPLDQAKKQVMAVWNPLKGRLDKARRDLRAKMNKYTIAAAEERRRIAAEERRRKEEEALRLAEKIDEGDSQIADDFLDASIKAAERKQKSAPVRGTMGSAVSVRRRWVGEVTDLATVLRGIAEGSLPESLVQVSQGAVNAYALKFASGKAGSPALKDGDSALIAGLRIYQKQETSVR